MGLTEEVAVSISRGPLAYAALAVVDILEVED